MKNIVPVGEYLLALRPNQAWVKSSILLIPVILMSCEGYSAKLINSGSVGSILPSVKPSATVPVSSASVVVNTLPSVNPSSNLNVNAGSNPSEPSPTPSFTSSTTTNTQPIPTPTSPFGNVTPVPTSPQDSPSYSNRPITATFTDSKIAPEGVIDGEISLVFHDIHKIRYNPEKKEFYSEGGTDISGFNILIKNYDFKMIYYVKTLEEQKKADETEIKAENYTGTDIPNDGSRYFISFKESNIKEFGEKALKLSYVRYYSYYKSLDSGTTSG